MSGSIRRLAGAVASSPKKSPAAAGLANVAARFYGAQFIQTESADSNLSRIQIGNSTFRYVPRLSSAWTTAPAQGTTILVASVGGSLIILGVQVGNTGLATYP